MNKFIVTGRLTRDPETKETKDGGIMTSITVASQRGYKDKVTNKYESDFFNFSFFAKLSDQHDKTKFVREYCKKGDWVEVESEVRNDNKEEKGVKTYGFKFNPTRIDRAVKGPNHEQRPDYATDDEMAPI